MRSGITIINKLFTHKPSILYKVKYFKYRM